MPLAYVMVGSGIASLSAAEAIRQRQPDASITVVSEEPHDFYSRPGLAYFLRGDIPESQLMVRSRDDLKTLNVKRVHGLVKELRCDGQELLLSDNRRLRFDRLLLAAGALAAPPTFPGRDLAGVVKLDGLDDTRRILALAKRGKPAVVVGGGITALELAEGLCARGMKVHYFLRGERYWADVLDETESKIIMDRLKHDGIVIHTKTQVKQALGKAGQLAALETEAGETVPCTMLAVAIGVRPRVELARQAGLSVDKGIMVNPRMQTTRQGVFAAGDCAQVGSTPLDVLWPTALAQGKVAGVNMAGGEVSYEKAVACNVTMLAGLRVTIIGNVGPSKKAEAKDRDLVAIARGDSESWRVLPNAHVLSDSDDVNRVRLFIGPRTIVGALVMGEQSWSRPLQHLIGQQVDIAPLRDVLIKDAAAGLNQLAEFYERWQAGKPR
ncbi:MAG TPA: FAD-dependent oxidoreductase [Gemmataceae bacterium]|nr:FAD-dependent oxidoreductase [Gemmataceae bacterium]